MSDIGKCNRDIYEKGEAVAIIDAPKAVVEALVQYAANKTGRAIDWHYVGGRAVVKALGSKEDLSEVRDWFETNGVRMRVLP